MTYTQHENPFLLKKRQEDAMKRHSEHHSKKHMDLMKQLMKDGKTFTEAHELAMKKVGK
tara:strand:+ start:616 stop:792 length:177 start_codon:yes stop_codon:yes gene_type:complete